MSKNIRKSILPALLISAGLLHSLALEAQEEILLNPAQYLFPEFIQGRVGMKAGRDLNLIMNYNIVTAKIVFRQKGQIYDMTEYYNVDTVYAGGIKLVPAGKGFMELAVEGRITLLLQHTGRIQSPPKPAAYGGTSEISSSTYINNLPMGADVYRLKNDPTLIIKKETIHWIKTGDRLEQFTNQKQLEKILPDHRDRIRSYVKSNRVKFDNPLHVIKLIEYCNTSG